MIINSIYADNIIKTALLEDINYLDTTTDYLIDEEQEDTAKFLAKSDGVLCGIEIALRVFEILQPTGFEAKVYKKRRRCAQEGRYYCGNSRQNPYNLKRRAYST